MARVQKMDNALEKHFAKSEKKKQKEGTRELRAYFLIVCEGKKTEPNYFKSFPQKVGTIVYDLTFDGGGISTTKVVEKAIELRDRSPQKYDRVWAVFDKDSFKANSFNAAISKALSNNIGCAWSNQAFELWYLLHFHNRITAMHRDEYKKAIEDAINNKIKKKSKSKVLFKYQKNDLNMYHTLETYGNQEQAIKWAKELKCQYSNKNYADQNPCTLVFEIIEELTGKSDKLKQEIYEKYEIGG